MPGHLIYYSLFNVIQLLVIYLKRSAALYSISAHMYKSISPSVLNKSHNVGKIKLLFPLVTGYLLMLWLKLKPVLWFRVYWPSTSALPYSAWISARARWRGTCARTCVSSGWSSTNAVSTTRTVRRWSKHVGGGTPSSSSPNWRISPPTSHWEYWTTRWCLLFISSLQNFYFLSRSSDPSQSKLKIISNNKPPLFCSTGHSRGAVPSRRGFLRHSGSKSPPACGADAAAHLTN